MWKHRILAPDSWGAYQRNDFSEPRLLHLPIQSAKFLNLRYPVFFNNNLTIIFCHSDYLPFVAKLLYILAPPSPPRSSFLGVTWDAASRAWSPQYVPRIKHNSQLLGCEYFFSQHQEVSMTSLWVIPDYKGVKGGQARTKPGTFLMYPLCTQQCLYKEI